MSFKICCENVVKMLWIYHFFKKIFQFMSKKIHIYIHTQTHTHTYIYIYIYICCREQKYRGPKNEGKEKNSKLKMIMNHTCCYHHSLDDFHGCSYLKVKAFQRGNVQNKDWPLTYVWTNDQCYRFDPWKVRNRLEKFHFPFSTVKCNLLIRHLC